MTTQAELDLKTLWIAGDPLLTDLEGLEVLESVSGEFELNHKVVLSTDYGFCG